VPSFQVARGDEVEGVPVDVLGWWRAADARRRELIAATRGAPLSVAEVEPMEPRRTGCGSSGRHDDDGRSILA
jgi:hypothetical protein